jgi:cytochrome c peroxidase
LARPNLRRAPSLANAAWQRELGWDGRFPSLEAQLPGHLHGQLGADADSAIAAAIEPTLAAQFQRAFARPPNGADAVAALAAFVRTRYSGGSRWDRQERAAQPAAELKAGYDLFLGKAQCSVCHPPPLYTDLRYHRLGLIGTADEGRGLVEPAARGAFKTPSLRGVALRPRLFHDASVTTLEAAVDWHLRGGTGQGADPAIIDPALHAITLTAAERGQLLTFLAALTPEAAP